MATIREQLLTHGILTLPSEKRGLDTKVFDEKRKFERMTDAKKYLGERNKYLEEIATEIDKKVLDVMDDTKYPRLKDIPRKLRVEIADMVGDEYRALHEKIANKMWPEPQQAYAQTSNLNTQNAIIQDNIVAPTAKTRKPRAKKPSAKKGKK